VTLRAAGSRLNVNSVDDVALAALFAHLRVPRREADSLVDALLDWRDRDDAPRPNGAERAWYLAHALTPPRNGALADAREVRRVRGFDRVAGLDTLLGVETERVPLDQAALPVLAALPGFGDEAVNRAAELRARGVGVGDVIAFAGQLSPNAREMLLSRYADLAARTTVDPDAWILTSIATGGSPAVRAAVELRLVRSGTRAAIVRRRTWIA
jgi:type II secretory pathway component PulK